MSQALTRNEQLQQELALSHQQSAQREQELITLLEPQPHALKSAARSRSGTLQSQPVDLPLTQDAYLVKLQLEFDKPTSFKKYRATLQLYSGGDEIWSQSRLPVQSTNKASIVIVVLPATIFTQVEAAVQEYKLTLWGADAVEEFEIVEVYAFRVTIEKALPAAPRD